MNAAAILFFVLFLKFTSSKNGVEVATLTDSMNAKWATTQPSGNVDYSFQKRARLIAGSSMLLNEGLVEILFDDGTNVTLEGPAEFQILSDEQIDLRYGRLYASVPHGSVGFTVSTQRTRIIDLGTEFGVETNLRGDVSLYVMKGKTLLIAGDRFNKVSLDVSQGNAKHVSSTSTAISDLPFNENLFIREINSKYDVVWRGEYSLSLADIVGGGNGFGTGRLEYGINTSTSAFIDISIPGSRERYSASNEFHMVDQHSYIDGVFVPNSKEKPQVINSRGDVFQECPETSGRYHTGIINGTQLNFAGGGPLTLSSVRYGSRDNPSIFIHANQGITFDLDTMRQGLGGKHFSRFSALCGISEIAPPDGLADIYVLVDGQVRFCQKNIEKGQSYNIDFPLNDQNRFLTLVTVTSENKENLRREKKLSVPTYGDWCMFANPSIVLED